jgi:hypothetical protein
VQRLCSHVHFANGKLRLDRPLLPRASGSLESEPHVCARLSRTQGPPAASAQHGTHCASKACRLA